MPLDWLTALSISVATIVRESLAKSDSRLVDLDSLNIVQNVQLHKHLLEQPFFEGFYLFDLLVNGRYFVVDGGEEVGYFLLFFIIVGK